ncbi:MerR family transcriptional regulator [Aestuariirhabdus sp. Z084]|uniref:MerR family transcriptional regulator n=1 Tax=Aestuariirhabdus haliotis TaxID=2918751 RepID=UPI00201B3E2E|nr:MerR family transcriptional regulator [Aestuariirhabdus haliotis]MCL6417797.1 MerR family transcriptional regulator [Aestuariirhabdus haliotis]MCL6421722.1 MerR family transcriptional regulator [Aestuariirhabdus haliotis]
MKIGELARRAEVKPSTIRYYESRGLMPAAERRGNGYRYYSEDALVRLRMIQYAQHLGLPLEGIATLMSEGAVNPERKAAMKERLQHRVAEIDAMQQLLANQRQHLQQLLGTLDHHWAQGRCVPENELARLADCTADLQNGVVDKALQPEDSSAMVRETSLTEPGQPFQQQGRKG